jgi:type I restriction enzyme S subunit
MKTSGCIHDGWLVLSDNKRRTVPDFFYHLLGSPFIYSKFKRLAAGVTVKNLNIDLVRGVTVPVPPIDEQRRIAAILDAADALRAKRRAALAKLDTLAQSIFIEMFGNPVANERSWKENGVGDFVAGFESGKNLVSLDEEDKESKFRVLKVSAVTSLEYRPDECKSLPEGYIPPSRHVVRPGDLLFSRANTSDLVGATALVYNTPLNIVLPDKIWRFVWHEKPRADPHFVWFLFRHHALATKSRSGLLAPVDL